ncbi:CsxC family protein [Anaerosacchariphilus polymeriproducens]|uniref:CsxC family protein n=1 Tax=Anaerosacchariphilus polymeriproducens TaxID=1812858 RepID=UPI001F3E19ED|nr:hypothetical protein [Anaerosacchariphilus polymeriproducens]
MNNVSNDNKERKIESKSNATVVSTETHISSDCHKDCDSAVLKSDTLPGAENYPWFGGEYKIPKVLAEFIVQIDSESKIRLNEPSYEIKRIEKQVFLTQCRYIPPTDKVFIEGYIRKNIEYATKHCTSKTGIGGAIKDTTVHIPFKTYTKVNFCGNLPQVQPNYPPMVARYFDQKRMGKNFREADRSDIEIFNEPVYCELEWSAVFDADIDNKGTPIDGFINEEEFQEFTDKSVVYLCMKLLQKQQVCWFDPFDKDGKGEKQTSKLDSKWNLPITEMRDSKK